MESKLERFRRLRKEAMEKGVSVEELLNGNGKTDYVVEIKTEKEEAEEVFKPPVIPPVSKKPPKESRKKTKEERSPPKQARSRPRGDTAREYIEYELQNYTGKILNLDKFTENVREILDEHNAKYKENTPLKGYISKIIYETAEKNKYVDAKARSTIHTKRRKDPVTIDDLTEEIVGFKLTKKDKLHIVGVLDKEYVLKNYPLNKDTGSFSDSTGDQFNIEGTPSWGGDHKAICRQNLCNTIDDIFLGNNPNRAKDLSHLNGRKKELESELDELTKKLDQQKRTFMGYVVKSDKGGIISLNNSELTRIKESGLFNVKKTATHLMISAKSEEYIPELKKEWTTLRSVITRSSKKSFKKSINIRDYFEDKRDPALLIKKDKIENEILELENEMKPPSKPTKLTVLSLEGPLLTSYIQIFNLLNSNGVRLEAFLPEYMLRDFNLMVSMNDANRVENGIFDSITTTYRNIDDLILTDFVKNKNFYVGSFPGKKSPHIYFGDEYISKQEYDLMLFEIDQKESFEKLSEKYNVSENFVKTASDRYNPKFDIAFLDYYGGETDRRKDALENLIPRLNKKSIVAITTNITKKLNPAGLSPDDIIERQVETLENHPSIKAIPWWDHNNYTDAEKKYPMTFFIAHIEKK